ncbi:DUF2764 family protein [Marinifilum sp. RC60d5]|uniref:DUF2764 family protein n=1 Tax=Marinifilum sp. RC60d5 TaxID=3458414 RepID=UPI00403755BE
MSNMVYLMSSLPSLTFGHIPPISLSEFNNDAKNQLSAKQFRMLEALDIVGIKGNDNAGLKSVNSMLESVNRDLSEVRKAKMQNRQPTLDRLPVSVTSGNPLEREKQIMKYVWEELDSIESGKTFTMTEVMVYKLKLQILCRINSFDLKRGAEVLASVVNPTKKEEDE